MKHPIYALACVTMLSQAPAFGQTQIHSYLNEKLTQRIQQLASAGAQAARKAYSTDGLYGVAKQSSDCMAATRSGKISSHHCLGIESVGLELRSKTPLNSNTKTAQDWFSPKEMANRINGHCFVFLGLRTDMECGQTFAIAKLASEKVTAGITSYKGDQTGDPIQESRQQSTNREGDKPPQNLKNAATTSTASPTQNPASFESVLAKYKSSFDCSKDVTSVEKMICSNAHLSSLDGLLYATYAPRYQVALENSNMSFRANFGNKRPSEEKIMRTNQKAWITERNKCEDVECLADAYANRIKELCSIPVPSSVSVNRDCEVLNQD